MNPLKSISQVRFFLRSNFSQMIRPKTFHTAINTQTSSGKPLQFWKWTKRVGMGLGALGISGALYQTISTQIDARKYPPIGTLIDMGGYNIHLHATGTGGPTVILDAGLGCSALSWSLVQSEIARFTHVVSFDRPGNGWSDESPLPRTSQNIVTELHTALEKAGIAGPYIFVGHSFGGIDAQLFANLFPNQTLGVILVDSSHKDQREKMDPPPELNHTIMMLASRLGIVRLFMHRPIYKQSLAPFPGPIQNQLLAQYQTTKFMNTVLQETSHLGTSYNQLKATTNHLSDKPLTVITALKKMPAEGSGYTEAQIDAFYNVFQVLQKDLVTYSTQGKQVFAESDHMIPLHQPQIIVDAVKEMIDGLSK